MYLFGIWPRRVKKSNQLQKVVWNFVYRVYKYMIFKGNTNGEIFSLCSDYGRVQDSFAKLLYSENIYNIWLQKEIQI